MAKPEPKSERRLEIEALFGKKVRYKDYKTGIWHEGTVIGYDPCPMDQQREDHWAVIKDVTRQHWTQALEFEVID